MDKTGGACRADGDCEAVVGSLDVVAVRALADEVLIGNSRNPAYLANVCVADEARRRRVGSALIESARQTAREWGADSCNVLPTQLRPIDADSVRRGVICASLSWQPRACSILTAPSSVDSRFMRMIRICLMSIVCAAGVEDLFVHIMAANEGGLCFYTQHGFNVVAEESANRAHYRSDITSNPAHAARPAFQATRVTQIHMAVVCRQSSPHGAAANAGVIAWTALKAPVAHCC